MVEISNNDKLLTYGQFIEVYESIKDNTGNKTEYDNGRIVYFSPIARHGKVIRNICNILEDKLPKECVVAGEQHIKFTDSQFRIPDVSVFCGKDIKDKYRNDILHLEIPKIIFEVISESTEKNDREVKMNLYAKAGIEEYLIVDYKNESIEQYILNNENYSLNRKYKEKELIPLILYPMVSFITSEIFELFRTTVKE